MIVPVKTRDTPNTSTFSYGEGIGVVLVTLSGVASGLAAVYILILIFRRIRKDRDWEALDVPVIALFVAEIFQGIGEALNLKWVIERASTTGSFCTTQAIFQQLGETGAALATLTIAALTFLSVWRLKTPNRKIYACIVGVEAVFVVLIVAIGFGIHTNPPREVYGAPVPYWCWIGYGFSGEQIGLEYLWFWVTLFGSFLLYIPLFLLHFRFIKPGEQWYSPSVDLLLQAGPPHEDGVRNGLPGFPADVLSRDAKLWSTILYPILYCILVLPLSVVRFMAFHRPSHKRPVETFIVINLFTLSGVFNALLYRLTRANFFQPQPIRNAVPPPVRAL